METTSTNDVTEQVTASGTRYAMLPRVGDSAAPTLVLLAMGDKDTLGQEPYGRVGRLLHSQGWNVVSLDLPCHGADIRDSEPAGLKGWASRMEAGENVVESFRARVNDVVDYLVVTDIAAPDCLAAAGTSRGGFMAFHAAAGNPRIRSVAAFAPVTDLLVLREFKRLEQNLLVQDSGLANAAELLGDGASWITIGDADERVGTDKAVEFVHALERTAATCGRSDSVVLRVVQTPGHASFPEWHDAAAVWLNDVVKRKD